MKSEDTANDTAATTSERKWRNQIKCYYLPSHNNIYIALYVFFTFFMLPIF